MSDDYDAAVAASMQPEPAQAARVGFAGAADTNPDAYAEARRVAQRTGVPVDTVFAMPQEMKRQDQMGAIDFDALAKTSPATAALLADMDKAKLAHDDVGNMSGIESALYAFGKFEVGTAKAIASAVPKFNEGAWGVARAGADLMPDFVGKPLSEKFAQYGKSQRDIATGMMPKADGLLESSWYSGMQSLGLNVLLLPAAVASGGSAAPVLAGMGLSQGGSSYGEARDAGVSVPQSLAFGASQGAIEAGTEMIGLPALLSTLKPGKFLTKAAEYMVKEQGGEQIATHLQDMNEWAVLHPEKTIGDYLAARPDAALQTALATAFSGGGQLAVVKSIGLMTQQKVEQAQQAPQMAELLAGLNKMAEASKLRERDGETAQGFFQSILAEGRDAVYITPDALAQSGLADQMAQAIPAVREQLQTAAESGHDIRIPIADLMVQMAGPELEQALLPHLATEPGGFTSTTAQEYLQSGAAQELQAEVERVLTEKEGDDTFKASAAAVSAGVKAQLDTAARFTPQVNDAYATMVGNFYAVQAARMGTTPEAMFAKYPLQIGAQAIDGQQFDQGGTLAGLRQQWTDSGIKGDVFEKDGIITLSRIVVPEGERSTGKGTEAIKSLLAYADATGQHVVLSPSADFGGNKKRLTEFYKRFGFVENKGKNRAFTTRESMYRQADGKVLYQGKDYNQGGKRKRDDYALDLFGVPDNARADASTQQPAAGRQGGSLSRDDAPGTYASRTELVQENTRQLGTDKVVTTEDAAQAMAYLAKGAVERFDALITDKDGTPLAVVGAFKGALTQASVFPSTIVGEAFRVNGAANIWFAHNHPSGTNELSNADRQLHSNLAESFRGSEIKARGIFAIAGKEGAGRNWVFEPTPESRYNSEPDMRGATTAPVATASVPVVERVYTQEDRLGPAITSPAIAKDAATNLSGGESGVVLLTAQNEPVAFVPVDPAGAGVLRQGGRMDALYRALSVSNAGAAIIVDNGNLGDQVAQNLAGLFNSIDARVLDVMDTSGDAVQSWAEQGKQFSDRTFNQSARGSFNPATLSITLLKNADLSTFLHESGHFFLEVQADLASQLQQDAGIHGLDTLTPGERQILADAQALLDWFGVKSLGEWNNLDFEEKRSYHEQFARGFESYLFEGKAPSIELQGLFQRFRAWMLNVYRELRALNVEITDEVRGVFDRMLATTEQITLAEQGRSMMPLFTSPEQAGMTPDEFAEYQALGTDATNEAIEDLQARGLRDMQWIHNARGRIIKQMQKESAARRAEVQMGVRSEVMSQPVYRAWEYLTGKDKATPDSIIEDTDGNRWAAHGRLDRASLDDMGLPPEVMKLLDARHMVKKDSLHPDIVAELFGFTSGDELVRTLAASDKPADVIEGMTDQRMLEQYGDLSSQEAIEKAADKAIHNDVRARMLATELNALAKATGQHRTLASAAKEYAATMIARLKVRNIKPGQYASAEVRAGKTAEKASKAGDLTTAAAEKRNQLINAYATRAAYDAQDEMEKHRRDWSAFANRADDKIKKSYDMDLVNAVRAILGEYGIAEKKAKRALDYLETVKTQDPEMYGIVSASIGSASQNAKPFREMTVEEVRGLAAEIDAILHLARRSRQMEVDGDLMDRRDVEDALRARMVDIGVPDDMPGDGHAITAGETRMLKFKTALASMTRAESWAGKMDGMAPFGPFRRFVWSRIKDSADAYRTDKAKYLKQLRALFDSVAPSLKPGLIFAPELNYTFGKDSGGSAINEILHAILHTGNESNLRKLLLGRRWATERPDGAVDTSRWDAFIDRMAKEGKITKAHFDFAQGVWDLLESTKPLAQKTHRDVFGKYFDEVTATPRNTPFGVYAGGYVPAQADSRIVADANLRALAESENASMAFAFPSTAKGFTKARVEYNRPLLLDLRTLSQHLDKVLLFSHMEMPVRDVQRVLGAVSGTLNRIDPAAIAGLLTPWLNRAARQQVTTPITADAGLSRFLMTMRSRAGAAAMFGNIANAVQQITGFSLAAVKVKPSMLLSSSVDFLKAPRQFAAAVAEASSFMADRMHNEVSAMNDDINQILLNPTLLESGQAWTMQHAYFLQAAIDNSMSPIIWTAAYNQALEQGLEHKDAVRLGDSAVRETQGSTLPEDVSRIESGPAWARMFTQFAGYFNMQANLLGTEFAKLMQEYGLRKGAGRGLYVFTLGFLAPAIAGELVMQLFRGGPGDDDKDGEYLDDWLAALLLWAPLRNATAMIPVAGSAINSAINAWNGKPYDDRIASSPAVSMLESAAKAPVSAYKSVADDGNAQKAVRDVATLISMTVGLPANLAARPLGYLAGVADGKTNPTSAIDAARGVVTGAASPESKR